MLDESNFSPLVRIHLLCVVQLHYLEDLQDLLANHRCLDVPIVQTLSLYDLHQYFLERETPPSLGLNQDPILFSE